MSSPSSQGDTSSIHDSDQQSQSKPVSWEERLFTAVSQGNVRVVRYLLKKGVDVNATHPSGRTPLGTAAHLGNVEILRMLLESSLNYDEKDYHWDVLRKYRQDGWELTSRVEGATPKAKAKILDKNFRTACKTNDSYDSKFSRWKNPRSESLSSEDDMSEGSDKDYFLSSRRYRKTPREKHEEDQVERLHHGPKENLSHAVLSDTLENQNCSFSGTEESKEELQSKGKGESNQGYFIVVHSDYSAQGTKSDVESDECEFEENLAEAVTPDDMKNLEWDSELQVDDCNSPPKDIENTDSWTDLYCWYADYLAQSCGTDMSVQHHKSPHIDVNQLDVYRRSAMHYAAEQGNLEVLHLLLRAGCLVDVGDSDDVTPLHLAAARDNPDTVALLISNGAKVNHKSIDGTGPLHMAAARGFLETANILLKHGACVNALDRSDRTPLLLAVSRGIEDMVKLLISHGARVNVEDILGYTPLCQAVWQQEKEIVRMLLAAGARLTHSDRLLHCAILHRCPDIAKMLIGAGSIVNLRDDSGDTPLIIAARSGQVDMVNLLLSNGAVATYVNGLTGSTPLHEAVECLRPAQCSTLLEILLLLLRYRGSSGLLNMETSSVLDTPLVRALVHDKDHAIIMLIQHGADVNLLQQHTPVVSEAYLKKRPSRWIIAQLMVFAGLNLWQCNEDISLDVKYPEDSAAAWIASMKFNPMSLSSLCRLKFRLHHGENLYQAVLNSGLPPRLRKFIMLEDIADATDYLKVIK